MKRVHFVPNRCIGCEECVVACEKAHGWQARGFVEIVDGYFPIPMRCNHCADAPCKAACPTGAVLRNEFGAVVVDEAKCIGCGTCAEVCPFGVPRPSAITGKPIKCDLCTDRLAEGEDPACVVACPKQALVFVEDDEPLEERRQRLAREIKAAASYDNSLVSRSI